MAVCDVCFRKCNISEGGKGFCRARTCENGRVTASNYGKITSLALDPIEKKPLARFFPGSLILSAGSYGCNLRCPFCQNHEIAWPEGAAYFEWNAEVIMPEELAAIAVRCRDQGNIGAAFTYNEPLVGYEYVRDAAKLIHEAGMKNVLVTNGTASLQVLSEIAPYIDAMNIDMKGFSDRFYTELISGSREMTMAFISEAVKHCHVELTMLIIPGENDSEEEMRALTEWIAGLKDGDGTCIGENVPLHITRFFPRHRMTDRGATDVRLIYRLRRIAQERLRYVYAGNC